jgi:hypothetical protein
MGCKQAKPKPQLREVDFQRRYVATTGHEPHLTQQLRRDGGLPHQPDMEGAAGPASSPAGLHRMHASFGSPPPQQQQQQHPHPGYAPVVPTPRSTRSARSFAGDGEDEGDTLVMICADCGIEIDETAHQQGSVRCPRTGKLHW